MFAVNIDGSDPVTLVKPFVTGTSMSFVPRTTAVLRRLRDNPYEVLVSANDRSADTQDVYRMNVHTGRKALVNATSPGNVVKWMLDTANLPRAAYCMDLERGRFWFAYLAGPQGREWKTFAQWDEQLKDVIIPLAFDPTSPKLLFVASNVGRDMLALFDFDTSTGKLNEMIHGDDGYDVFSFLLLGIALGEGGRLIFGGTEEKPAALVGLSYQADKPKFVWCDEAATRAHASVAAAFAGSMTSLDVDSPRALVFTRSNNQPCEYFIYDRDKRAIEDTGIRTRPDINPEAMRPMQPVSWTARDGLRIDGYLTLPAVWDKGKPVPLVLRPHGGSWARDNWSFNPDVQFIANRSFAVLQPNFRGSTSYGARHLRLCHKQWGGTMIEDMIDGVEWVIKTGCADADRIGVYGASYGGYATLMAMVRRPDQFKWGINYVSVADMKVHQDTQPAQLYGNFAELAKWLNCDQKADAAMFADQSPARHVNCINAPVFHVYGGEDRNVDTRQRQGHPGVLRPCWQAPRVHVRRRRGARLSTGLQRIRPVQACRCLHEEARIAGAGLSPRRLLRRQPNRPIQPDHLAIEHLVGHDLLHHLVSRGAQAATLAVLISTPRSPLNSIRSGASKRLVARCQP